MFRSHAANVQPKSGSITLAGFPFLAQGFRPLSWLTRPASWLACYAGSACSRLDRGRWCLALPVSPHVVNAFLSFRLMRLWPHNRLRCMPPMQAEGSVGTSAEGLICSSSRRQNYLRCMPPMQSIGVCWHLNLQQTRRRRCLPRRHTKRQTT